MAGKRQATLAGLEHPNSIPELDGAAEKFKASSKKRKQWQDTEIEDRALVVRLMEKHNLEVYEDRDAGLIITLDKKTKAKVQDLDDVEERAANAPNEESEEDGDDEPAEPKAPTKPLKQRAAKKSAPEA